MGAWGADEMSREKMIVENILNGIVERRYGADWRQIIIKKYES